MRTILVPVCFFYALHYFVHAKYKCGLKLVENTFLELYKAIAVRCDKKVISTLNRKCVKSKNK